MAGHQRPFFRYRILSIGRIPDKRPAGFELCCHFRTQVLHSLERPNDATELLPLFGIVDSFLYHHLTSTECISGNHGPPGINHLLNHRWTAVRQPFGRNIFKTQFGDWTRKINCREVNPLETRSRCFDQKERTFLVRDDKEISSGTINDKKRRA